MTIATISNEIPSISEELEGMTENLACLESDAKTMWKMIRHISRFALEITRKTEDSEIEQHSTRIANSSRKINGVTKEHLQKQNLQKSKS
ncbi:unnamed protein product [Oikopleura dioica]|uniref:Uncharacterized protein n=1 Tax=Oikopleura dioica TaxID=34765 RepID=E4X1S1_OIKDI|nr:unnamed protein product [Oikopleura dioica]CBY34094.1 unnamed protein product [Oikopleura dioica]